MYLDRALQNHLNDDIALYVQVHKNDPEDSLSVVKRRSFQYDFEGFDVLAGLRKANTILRLCYFCFY